MESSGADKKKKGLFADIFRVKCPDKMLKQINESEHKLKKTLDAFDLTMLGIGAIIGAGIFTLSGTAAAGSPGHIGAGPALIVSFIISGTICGIAALCYAEFVAMIPVTGSAYTYTYTTLGEIVAWMIGWILVFEYSVGNITVVCGWSGYFFELLRGMQPALGLPDWLVKPPHWLAFDYGTAALMYAKDHCNHGLQHFCSYDKPGFDYATTLAMYAKDAMPSDFPMLWGIPISVNVPAIFIIIVVTTLLYIGIKESARTAAIMVIIKILVILAFIAVGVFFIKPVNWTPFMPHGVPGILMGAFLVFFAYIGFDSVATAAEETKNPSRDLPIGIIASLAVCTVLYIIVAAILTGMVPTPEIDTHAPIAAAMTSVGQNWISGVIAIGAITGLFSVILVEQLAVTRIFFAMSRDGLIPKIFSKVHPKYQTPYILTVSIGVIVAIGTLFLDINKAAELCNIGTLSAFALVCVGIIILRYTQPERKRPFRVPWVPWLPAFGAIASMGLVFYSMFNPVTPLTHARAFYTVWIILGLVIYFIYSRFNSVLKQQNDCEE